MPYSPNPLAALPPPAQLPVHSRNAHNPTYPRERAAMIHENRRSAATAALRARRNMRAARSALQRATWLYLLQQRRRDLAYWNTYSRTFCYRAVFP